MSANSKGGEDQPEPAGQETKAAQRRDQAERVAAGQRHEIKRAAEQDDSGNEPTSREPQGPTLGTSGHARQHRDSEQPQSVIHVITGSRLEPSHSLGREPLTQSVSGESTRRDSEEAIHGGRQKPKFHYLSSLLSAFPVPPMTARFSLFYAVYFLQTGIMLPFWPIVLTTRGLHASELGIVFACQAALRVLIGPYLGFLSDRYRLGRWFLAMIGLTAFVGILGFSAVHGFWPVLVLSIIAAPIYSCILPMVDANAVGFSDRKGFDFGRVRLWGSLGFVAANILSGPVIAAAGPAVIVPLVLATTLAGACAVFLLPPAERHFEGARPDWHQAAAVLRSRLFIAVTLIAGSTQATHALLYGFGTLLWRAQGISETRIGALWAIGVLAEVVLLSQSKRLLRLMGAEGLLVLGSVACVVRWGASLFAPGFPALLVLQLLHGLTFAATYVGGLHLIQRAASPMLAATAQSLFAGIAVGILYGSASAVAGVLYGTFGVHAFVAPAALGALCSAGAVILFLWRRRSAAIAASA